MPFLVLWAWLLPQNPLFCPYPFCREVWATSTWGFFLLKFEILVFQMASRSNMLQGMICFSDRIQDWTITKVITVVSWKGFFFFNDKDVCKINLEGSHLCVLLRFCWSCKIDTSFNHLKMYICLQLLIQCSFQDESCGQLPFLRKLPCWVNQ